MAVDIRDITTQIKFGVDEIGEVLPSIRAAIEKTNRILTDRL